MGAIYTSGIDDALAELERLEKDISPMLDEVMDTALQEVGGAWKQSMRLHGFAPPGRSGQGTGAMINSVGHTPIRKGKAGRFAEVVADGTDSKGVSNDLKAFYQHYGTSSITPTYWLDDAEQMAEKALDDKLPEIYNRYMKQ